MSLRCTEHGVFLNRCQPGSLAHMKLSLHQQTTNRCRRVEKQSDASEAWSPVRTGSPRSSATVMQARSANKMLPLSVAGSMDASGAACWRSSEFSPPVLSVCPRYTPDARQGSGGKAPVWSPLISCCQLTANVVDYLWAGYWLLTACCVHVPCSAVPCTQPCFPCEIS